MIDTINKTTSSWDGGERDPRGQRGPEALYFQTKSPQRNAIDHRAFIVVRPETWDFCRSLRQKGFQEVVAVTFDLTGLCRVVKWCDWPS